jgi:iron complex outermembrane receptor protein
VRGIGDRDFDSEELLAFEIGYRVQPKGWLSLDITSFYNDYDNLRSAEVGRPFLEGSPWPPHIVIPTFADNKMEGEAYGVEAVIDCRLKDWWQLRASYSFLQLQLHPDRDSGDILTETDEERSPHHQVSLRSLMNLGKDLELDVWCRYVDSLPAEGSDDIDLLILNRQRVRVKSYVTLDVRLGWRPNENLEVSIVGQNLLDDQHLEFSKPSFINSLVTEIERSVYGKITWRF